MIAQEASSPGYEEQWWRALAVFRAFSVLYASAVFVLVQDDYQHVAAGWLVLSVLVTWTGLTFAWYRHPKARRWPLLSVDLMVAAAAIVITRPLQVPEAVERGAQTLPVFWVVAPVIAWAVVYGWPAALPASALVGMANVIERGDVTAPLLHNVVLVVVAGAVVGYVATLARRAERRLARALGAEAATRERERLARAVHDGVLQVLTYVSRHGREPGADPAELARLAAEQEVALRALITTAPAEPTGSLVRPAGPMSELDLRELLMTMTAPRVSVATPPRPVLLATEPAREVAAAVAASLDNVRQHAGDDARAFVLLDDDSDEIVVTVRDTGQGFVPGRLEQAAAEGRIGVARSIVGRMTELGGSATHQSCQGDGVEVVLRLPSTTVRGVRPKR